MGRGAVFLGWCAGRNPPSVQRRHSAKRATRASRRNSQAPICPFTLQVGRFTASTGILNDLTRIIVLSPNGRSVSAPEPRLSPHVFAGVAVLRGGRSFLKRTGRSKAVRQLTSLVNAE